MKTLTIVPEDKTVVVDGMGFIFDFVVDPDIHAIQWDTDSGHIEYKSDKFNTTIDSIKEYDSIIAKHGEFKLEFEIEEKRILDEEKRILDEQKQFDEAQKLIPEYSKLREREYKSIREQLDMQYWDKKNDTNNWEIYIDTIKAKYPKE